MVGCIKCGSEGVPFLDVISKEGIVKICESCQKEDDLPLFRKPTSHQLKVSEETTSKGMYERLSHMAGVNPKSHREKFGLGASQKKEAVAQKDTSLRDLVDKTYKKDFKPSASMSVDFIPHFHWIIMRARRKKKLTQSDLAKEVGESKAAIEMAEKGQMPQDAQRFAKKLEVFLNVRLLNDAARREFHATPEDLGFDLHTAKNITVSDLQEMNRDKNTSEMVQSFEEEEELNTVSATREGLGAKFRKWLSKRDDDNSGTLETTEDVDLSGVDLGK